MPQPVMLKKLKLNGSMKTYKTSRTNTEKNKKQKNKTVLFTIGDWNAKVGSQEMPEVTGKFGLGVQNEARQRVLSREHAGHSKHPLPITQEMTLYMDITRWSLPKSD